MMETARQYEDFHVDFYSSYALSFRSRGNADNFTNSRKLANGFTPGVFKGIYFKIFISFVHCFGIIIKEKFSPFNQDIIQQHIMSINKVITPMTELSDPPLYLRKQQIHGEYIIQLFLSLKYFQIMC